MSIIYYRKFKRFNNVKSVCTTLYGAHIPTELNPAAMMLVRASEKQRNRSGSSEQRKKT